MKLYGIPNCSTVKKARTWLAAHDIPHQFFDYKKQGLEPELAQAWLEQIGWERLINRNGLTWRCLTVEQQKMVMDNASALPLMLEKPSIIKRPLLEKNSQLLHIGFDEAAYNVIFNL